MQNRSHSAATALAQDGTLAVTLWREYCAAIDAHCEAANVLEEAERKKCSDAPSLRQAEQIALKRLKDAEDAILELFDGSLESILVKLALWREMRIDANGVLNEAVDPTDTAVHGAYEDLMKLTGLDPVAESAMLS